MTRCVVRGALLMCTLFAGGCTTDGDQSAGDAGGHDSSVRIANSGEKGTPTLRSTGFDNNGRSMDDGGSMLDIAPAANDASGSDGTAGTPGDAGQVDSGRPIPKVSSDGDGDRTIGPNYTADPMVSDRGAPKGRRFGFTMTGSQSRIYKGINGNYNRNVSVYVPQQYVAGKPAALMVTQDSLGGDVLPNALDNLIMAKKLPVIVVYFVSNGGGDSVGSERGLEYDTVSGLYAEYINKEVLPRGIMEAKTQFNIDLEITNDPEGRATMGGSSGGAASFSMAWWHPDLFRRVLAFSGTYVNQVPAGSPFPHGCWVYHDVDPYNAAQPNGLIVQHCEPASGDMGSSNPGPCDTPLSKSACEAVSGCSWNTTVNKPLRVWLQSSTNDLGSGGAPGTYRNFDLANQRMAAALKARRYPYHYDHALGAGHVDGNVIRQTLVEALLWLWRGYPID